MKGKALILVLLAGGALWYWRKRTQAGANGDPVEIGRVGSDITTTDTRGDAIAKGIAALLGDNSAQGSLGYSDNEIDLTFTKGIDVASATFGPRLTANPYQSNTQEAWLIRNYQALADSGDPVKVEAARMFSWSAFTASFQTWQDKFYELLGF